MADLFAEMVRAVKNAATLLLTRKSGLSTQKAFDLLTAEALLVLRNATRTARSSMTDLLAVVQATI